MTEDKVEPKAYKGELTDFIPDSNNANRGTQRGQKQIQDSIREDGLARGIVIDANENVVAGNKTLENAVDIGINKAIIVETSGNELVVTKRVDWDLYEDESPRRYAWRDNQSALTSIDFDPEIMAADLAAGVDFSGIFTQDEQANLLATCPTIDEWDDAFSKLPDGDKSPYTQMTFTLHDTQVQQVKDALSAANRLGDFDYENNNSNGNALTRICEIFLTNGQS